MMKVCVTLLAACALVAGCGDDDDSTTAPSNAPVIFTAALSPANEVPPITNPENSGRGAAQISFDVTRNAANAVTAATATFYFQAASLPAGTTIVAAHIHPGPAGVNGPVIVNTGLTAAAPLLVVDRPVEFISAAVAVDPALAQAIINNPSAYYFNIHSVVNPGGVARGQLARTR
jgi:hypothetical protein